MELNSNARRRRYAPLGAASGNCPLSITGHRHMSTHFRSYVTLFTSCHGMRESATPRTPQILPPFAQFLPPLPPYLPPYFIDISIIYRQGGKMVGVLRSYAHTRARVLLNESPAAHPSAPSGRRRPGNGGGVSVRTCPPCDTCHKIVVTHAPRGIPQLPAPAHVHKLKIPSLLDIPAPPAPIVPPADTTCHKTPKRGPAVTTCHQPGARATPSHRLPPHMLSLGNPLTFFNISQQEAHPAAMKKAPPGGGACARVARVDF